MTATPNPTPESTASNERLAVARALSQIIKHRRTIEWLRIHRPQWLESPLQRELLYGTSRHYLSLSKTVGALLKKPIKAKDLDVQHLLLVGAYQLLHMETAEYAAVNECVAACRNLGKPWASGLVNGVLRSIQRQRDDQGARGFGQDQALADHPPWMISKLRRQHGEKANALLQANNLRAPMTLRINTAAIDSAAYKDLLKNEGIGFDDGPWPETIVLHQAQTAARLPGWQQGYCAVQDLAAQYATHLLLERLCEDPNLAEPVRILDACAAPGGKLFHLSEALRERGLRWQLHALDNSERRLSDTAAIAARLGHKTCEAGSPDVTEAVVLHLGDGTAGDLPFPQAFDAVLIDAPCSGSGTIRRNPDIRLLLEESAVPEQQSLQLSLLQNLWQHVKPGGSLLYSTCSVFAEENDQVIDQFLGNSADASVQPLNLAYGHQTEYGWQLLPSQSWTDGFYYCGLNKAPTT